ncbi:MAG: hypothetical protein ACOVOQ_17825 [Flavobacterium sp.]
MKKIVILLVFMLSSCGIPYDGETIINISFKFEDKNATPIQNIETSISSDFNSYVVYNVDDDVYNKKSDENGRVQLKMFKPVSTFAIHINSSSYLSYDIINITADTIQNNNFDFGTITMFKLEDLADFNITPNQVNSNKIIDKIEVVALKYKSVIDFSTPEVYYPTFNYSLKKNQNFTLKYTIKDLNNNSKQNFIENLSIANNTLNHIITY